MTARLFPLLGALFLMACAAALPPQSNPAPPAVESAAPPPEEVAALPSADSGPPVEADLIRQQAYKCWNLPPGIAERDVVIPLRVRLEPDGSVASAEIVDTTRFAADPAYRRLANYSRRAVLLCAPYAAPSARYEVWKDLTLKFTPRDVMGQ